MDMMFAEGACGYRSGVKRVEEVREGGEADRKDS